MKKTEDEMREAWNRQTGQPGRPLSPQVAQQMIDQWRMRTNAQMMADHNCPRCGQTAYGDDESLCVACDLDEMGVA